MINFFRRVFLRIHRWWVKDEKYREGEIWILQQYFASHPKEAVNFLSRFQKDLLKVANERPLLFQDYWGHIRKTIQLIDEFKLDPSRIIVDVGGLDGEVATIFAGSVPHAKVITYEPIASNFNILSKNIQKFKNIEAHNRGLSSIKQQLCINKTRSIASSSLLEVEATIQSSFFAENLHVASTESVYLDTLDNEIASNEIVNILKIDVQGYEMEVLKGASKTLLNTNIILIEMQNHDMYYGAPRYYEIDAYLRNQNFILYDWITSLRNEGRIYEWDGIYVKKHLLNK